MTQLLRYSPQADLVIKCKELHLILYQDTGTCLKHASCGIPKKLDTVRRMGRKKKKKHDCTKEMGAEIAVKQTSQLDGRLITLRQQSETAVFKHPICPL